MTPAVIPIAEFSAPADWRTVDCISDLHLHADDAATVDAFVRYLGATSADAVFVLGDLFEVWVGDDAALEHGSFEARCTAILREASRRRPIGVMHGNRDFLLSEAFHAASGTNALPDPLVLQLGAHRFLLAHGDALCLDDVDYLRFRAQVRAGPWQADFLARPLPERRALARSLRDRSEAAQRARLEAHATMESPAAAHPFADVDASAARALLHQAGASTFVHGHTHRPAEHSLGDGLRRLVLSDWDLAARPPRADVLRLSAADGSVTRLGLGAAAASRG